MLCGDDRFTLLTVQNSFQVVSCDRCGFVYVNPRPTIESIKDLYAHYHPDRIGEPELWRAYMERVFSAACGELAGMVPAGAKVLDVGCGHGFFVEEAARCGFKAIGIDFTESTVSYGRDRGLDLRCGTIEALGDDDGGGAEFEDASFDAVTMFYVLEHLTDPIRTLRRVRALLRPGGVLLLRVPHTTPIVKCLDLFGIPNNLFDPPYHLCDFSPRTIRRALFNSGFYRVRTFIGGATAPPKLLPRLVSLTSTAVAEALFKATGKRVLLPGVSKTTVARKPD